MGRTRVVNIRKETCNVYIGRAGYGKDGYSGIRSDWKQRWQKAVRLADTGNTFIIA